MTRAPGSSAPEGSRTVPSTTCVPAWHHASAALNNRAAHPRLRLRLLRLPYPSAEPGVFELGQPGTFFLRLGTFVSTLVDRGHAIEISVRGRDVFVLK